MPLWVEKYALSAEIVLILPLECIRNALSSERKQPIAIRSSQSGKKRKKKIKRNSYRQDGRGRNIAPSVALKFTCEKRLVAVVTLLLALKIAFTCT